MRVSYCCFISLMNWNSMVVSKLFSDVSDFFFEKRKNILLDFVQYTISGHMWMTYSIDFYLRIFLLSSRIYETNQPTTTKRFETLQTKTTRKSHRKWMKRWLNFSPLQSTTVALVQHSLRTMNASSCIQCGLMKWHWSDFDLLKYTRQRSRK